MQPVKAFAGLSGRQPFDGGISDLKSPRRTVRALPFPHRNIGQRPALTQAMGTRKVDAYLFQYPAIR